MSDAHKAALAEGRAQGRAVRRYLEALEAHKPKRGRKRTPDSMKKRLDRIAAELQTADPLKRLQLRQERLDLESELSSATNKIDLGSLEQEFIESAKPYSERKGHLLLRLARSGRSGGNAQGCRRQPRRRLSQPGFEPSGYWRRLSRADERSSGSPSVDPMQVVARSLRVRHEPDDVAALVGDACDVVDEPFGLRT